MTGTGIAVVGLSCRYPDAVGPDELWQTVLGRRRAFRRLPDQRLSAAYRGGPEDPDLTYASHAGLLRDWRFDRDRFGIPGPLHRAVDHTHWLALEVAADALADAGHPDARGLDRERAGIVLGNTLAGEFSRAAQLRLRWPFVHRAATAALDRAEVPDDQAAQVLLTLEDLIKRPFPVPGVETLAGALANTIAGRVCNHFDLHGGGYTVDGACSSSLLAVISACRSLAAGELDFALAGGVDLSLDPFELVGFARLAALATDEMRIYDADPTGFLPGEGAGVVALMRAGDAAAAGLRSYATIAGWGVSSDGAGGLTRPEEGGQVRALRRAYEMAGVEPSSVALVEGHGTGTAVGDHVELLALGRIRRAGSPRGALGSIKANIGHTKAAAGVAGLIKAALAVHHRVLPPTTGCRNPHDLLRRGDFPLRVLAGSEPWPTATPRAAVSAMGFGGINTHIVLDGPPVPPTTVLAPVVRAWGRPLPAHEIVLLTADHTAALAARLETIAVRADALSTAELHDLAATLHAGRQGSAAVRCALVADTPETLARLAAEARSRLDDWDGSLQVRDRHVLASGAPARVGLLFPGQAAPVRTRLDAWADGLAVPSLPGSGHQDGDTDTAVAQPAIVRQSLAALAWLEEIGCHAVGAVGHSLGEISALVWAGALTPADGLTLAAKRGLLMATHATKGTTMAGFGASADETRELMADLDVTVSALNAPDQTTVSGPADVIHAAVDRARLLGIAATELRVSHGFHSDAMRPVRQPLRNVLAATTFAAPDRPVFSTVTGRELGPHPDLAGLLVDQLTTPVRFTEALAGLAESCDLLVEAGSGTTLSALARRTVGIPAVSMDCGAPQARALATAVLVAAGAGELEPWFAGRAYRTFDIDTPVTLLTGPCESIAAAPAKPVPVAEPVAEPVADPTGSDSFVVVRDYLSATLELPEDAIAPNHHLLGDLHLNSLQLLQIVVSTAATLGVQPPRLPDSLAGGTVRDLAELLIGQPEAGREGVAKPSGVRPWVRSFEHRWVPHSPTSHAPTARWAVHAPDGHWLSTATSREHPDGLAILLDDRDDVAAVATILRRLGVERPRYLLVLHQGHPAATAIARSAVVELDSCAATVIQLPDGRRRSVFDLAEAVGYQELRLRPDDTVERAVIQVRQPGNESPLPIGPGDVCLVTGGLNGITARCAVELAERTGCHLVVVGRSAQAPPPGMRYLQCDVTDPRSVRAACAAAREHGPIRGVLHGAGVNEPRPLADVTAGSLREMIAPKVSGLITVLSEADDGLRVVVGFGSIIGRRGLAGQAGYCVANEWLRHELADWARRHPDCRTRLLEWSAWDEVGMAARMGVLNGLRAEGIVPIEPALGARAMIAALADQDAPDTLLVASRFPDSPALTVHGPANRPLRFTEEVPVRVPGVEAMAESTLSLGTDPYLDEHLVDGVPVLPAVAGLEAMAQVAQAAAPGDRDDRWCFSDVRLHAPVIVDEHQPRVVRVAALADGPVVDLVVRDNADDFTMNRFTATVRPVPDPPDARPAISPPAASPVHPFYGPLFFHTGRFRRLIKYEYLSAFRIRAWINADAVDSWFSEFHSAGTLLGDLGAHDAALHILQACVPHRRVLPVRVGELAVWQRPSGPLLVQAQERVHSADDYTFDLHVTDTAGQPVARWQGLGLRAVGPIDWREPLPMPLLGPLVSRQLIELGTGDEVEVSTLDELPAGSAHWTDSTGPAQLGTADTLLAAAVADKADEPFAISSRRIWCARRTLADSGVPAGVPMTIDEVVGDVLVVLRGNGFRVTTCRPSACRVTPLVASVATRDTR
ncbi:type I polyketide synthase [Actinosynnema sp. CS-041913]|uniref:type I polyketide synthase n=1 Tax=Actinosynnema sp. CS-041913 TaxID=3239917 RepID=UPI003D8E9657